VHGLGRGGVGAGAEGLQRAVEQIGQIKLFQGDNYIDDVMYGETIAYSDNMLQPHTTYTQEQLSNWRTMAAAIAKAGLPLQQHATISETFPAFLDQIEQINKEYPIRNLRWAFAHMDQISANDLDRMKKLGCMRRSVRYHRSWARSSTGRMANGRGTCRRSD